MSIVSTAKAVALGLLLAAIVGGAWDWRSAREARSELRACVRAAKADGASLEGCAAEIVAEIGSARAGRACDAALLAGDRYREAATCPAGAKRAASEARVAAANLADAQRQIADLRAATSAAIARAEARAVVTSERTAHADAAIKAAPRDSSGIIRCDAVCLRELAGAPPQP